MLSLYNIFAIIILIVIIMLLCYLWYPRLTATKGILSVHIKERWKEYATSIYHHLQHRVKRDAVDSELLLDKIRSLGEEFAKHPKLASMTSILEDQIDIIEDIYSLLVIGGYIHDIEVRWDQNNTKMILLMVDVIDVNKRVRIEGLLHDQFMHILNMCKHMIYRNGQEQEALNALLNNISELYKLLNG